VLCGRCRAPLVRRLDEPPGAPVGLPVRLPSGIAQLEWCAAFTGPVRAALHALKYDGERRLAEVLGEVMARRWERAGRGAHLLVPVPVHRDRLRERGYDQAVLLAEAVGRRLRLPVVHAVERSSATAAQHALGRRDRERNVGGAFVGSVRHDGLVRGRWVLLIDDVMTTGATLAGCAAALHAAGAAGVSALTVARER
jgi:ComF family protein